MHAILRFLIHPIARVVIIAIVLAVIWLMPEREGRYMTLPKPFESIRAFSWDGHAALLGIDSGAFAPCQFRLARTDNFEPIIPDEFLQSEYVGLDPTGRILWVAPSQKDQKRPFRFYRLDRDCQAFELPQAGERSSWWCNPAWSVDGRFFALSTGHRNGGIRVFESATAKEILAKDSMNGLFQFSPNSDVLVATKKGDVNEITGFRVSDGNEVLRIECPKGFEAAAPQFCDGGRILSVIWCSPDNRSFIVQVFELPNGRLYCTLPEIKRGHFSQVEVSPCGRFVFMESDDNGALWDVSQPKPQIINDKVGLPLFRIHFNSRLPRMIIERSAGNSRQELWDTDTLRQITVFEHGNQTTLIFPTFFDNGTKIAIDDQRRSDTYCSQIRDANDGRLLRQISGSCASAWAFFEPCNRQLWTSLDHVYSRQGRMGIWPLQPPASPATPQWIIIGSIVGVIVIAFELLRSILSGLRRTLTAKSPNR